MDSNNDNVSGGYSEIVKQLVRDNLSNKSNNNESNNNNNNNEIWNHLKEQAIAR